MSLDVTHCLVLESTNLGGLKSFKTKYLSVKYGRILKFISKFSGHGISLVIRIGVK